MSMLTGDSGLIVIGVSVVSLLTSVGIAIINRENEHRFTSLEHNMMTKEERDKFMDVCFKMNMVWEFYEKQLPLLLKNPAELDELLDKASANVEALDSDERQRLLDYLNAKADSDDVSRKFWAGIYLKVLKSKGIERTC